MLWFIGNQRAQAQFHRAKWRLLVLLPIWMLQLGLTTAMIGLFAWRLGDTLKSYKDQDDKGGTPVIELVWECTNVGLAFIASICTFVEVVKYSAEALTPWTMLFTHIMKLTCSAAILALDVVVYVQRHDRNYSLIGLGLDGGFILVSIILVIYAVRAYRRLSVFDDYAHPINVKPFGFNDDIERDTSYQGSIGVRSSMDGRLSLRSSRLSLSSSKNDVALQKVEQQTTSVYSHKRDTLFEEYVARRSSVGGSDRAVSGDFSWTVSPADLHDETARRDSLGSPILGRPRGLSAPRAPSYASERGLVAVPEEANEAETHDKAAERKKAQEALLGGETPRDSISISITGPPVIQVADEGDSRRHG
ncbi:hypothetical protein BGZ63DRAFT_211343 [Mariannaea sp. PMI_226]|nr:hypothetical protein BGZ63DRAFT_211343 [Mariannaea sp. PMI_226]